LHLDVTLQMVYNCLSINVHVDPARYDIQVVVYLSYFSLYVLSRHLVLNIKLLFEHKRTSCNFYNKQRNQKL